MLPKQADLSSAFLCLGFTHLEQLLLLYGPANSMLSEFAYKIGNSAGDELGVIFFEVNIEHTHFENVPAEEVIFSFETRNLVNGLEIMKLGHEQYIKI